MCLRPRHATHHAHSQDARSVEEWLVEQLSGGVEEVRDFIAAKLVWCELRPELLDGLYVTTAQAIDQCKKAEQKNASVDTEISCIPTHASLVGRGIASRLDSELHAMSATVGSREVLIPLVKTVLARVLELLAHIFINPDQCDSPPPFRPFREILHRCGVCHQTNAREISPTRYIHIQYQNLRHCRCSCDFRAGPGDAAPTVPCVLSLCCSSSRYRGYSCSADSDGPPVCTITHSQGRSPPWALGLQRVTTCQRASWVTQAPGWGAPTDATRRCWTTPPGVRWSSSPFYRRTSSQAHSSQVAVSEGRQSPLLATYLS